MLRDLGAGLVDLLQRNRIDWSYFVRIDLAAPVGTKRFTDRRVSVTEDIDGAPELWSTADLKVGRMSQGRQGPLTVSSLSFANLDNTWTNWKNQVGLRGASVQVWAGWYTAAGAFEEASLIYEGKIDSQQLGPRSELALKPWRVLWGRRAVWAVPGPRCIYPFKDPLTCQYAGADTTCDHTRAACSAKGNLQHFGGFDLMPKDGEEQKWST